MTQLSEGKTLTLLSKPNLLFTESARKFKTQHEALKRTVSPRDFIEELYVAEMAENVWETQRLSRCKVVLINSHWSSAIEELLSRMGLEFEERRNLTYEYFGDETSRAKVCGYLEYFGLDESAIEAEAIKQAWPDLESIDRRLTDLAASRDVLLRRVAEYRARLAENLRESSDDLIDDVPYLVSRSSKTPA
jgi:hypothetical protein